MKKLFINIIKMIYNIIIKIYSNKQCISMNYYECSFYIKKNLYKNNNFFYMNYLKKFTLKHLTKLKEIDYISLIKDTNIIIEYDKNITINLIEKYSYKWDYWILSKNPNLTEEFILKYPYQNWDIEYLIKNNKVTDFDALSKFSNINKIIIDKYQDKPWNLRWIIANADIDENICNIFDEIRYIVTEEEFILKHLNQYWNIEYLIESEIITDFKELSKYKYLNQYIISNYPNKPWDWEWIIENTDIKIEKTISMHLIKKYKYKWDYWKLSKNPNLKEKFILKFPYKNWDIEYLIKNNKITDFDALSKFVNINQNIIDKYPNKQWNFIYYNKKYYKQNLIFKKAIKLR